MDSHPSLYLRGCSKRVMARSEATKQSQGISAFNSEIASRLSSIATTGEGFLNTSDAWCPLPEEHTSMLHLSMREQLKMLQGSRK